jgi:hypothetical protein
VLASADFSFLFNCKRLSRVFRAPLKIESIDPEPIQFFTAMALTTVIAVARPIWKLKLYTRGNERCPNGNRRRTRL